MNKTNTTPRATICEECEKRAAVIRIDAIDFCQSCADSYKDFLKRESQELNKLYRDLRNNAG